MSKCTWMIAVSGRLNPTWAIKPGAITFHSIEGSLSFAHTLSRKMVLLATEKRPKSGAYTQSGPKKPLQLCQLIYDLYWALILALIEIVGSWGAEFLDLISTHQAAESFSYSKTESVNILKTESFCFSVSELFSICASR